MSDPLRLGIVGGGLNSAVGYTHLASSQLDNRWAVVSGCFSRNQTVNQETARKWSIPDERLYSDWREMLAEEAGRLDAVSIITPTPDHYAMVLRAFEYGHNVICEKTLTSRVDDARRICAMQKQKGLFLAVTLNYSGYPMIRELRNRIAIGTLGKITQIQLEMPQEGYARTDGAGNRPTVQAWRLDDGEIPVISLDLGIHLQHLVYYLLGENPTDLVALQSTHGWFTSVVDNVMCISRYDGGVTSQMWYSKSALGHRNGLRIRIYGTHGSSEWFQMEPELLTCHSIDGTKTILDRASQIQVAGSPRYNRFKAGHPAGYIEAFANLYSEFADTLIDFGTTGEQDANWAYGGVQSVRGLEVVHAIAQSAVSSEWMKVGYQNE
ncbi:MAG: Gfo/Idh/MocA family oxidoreductase [Deltaproteobacteria bacterium]|nr:Gfo/Idh/MocA family oxidoreductase [Deltaproteobacteria bacterium]